LFKDILFATNSISNIFWVIVSKRPVGVTLLDPMQSVDAILDVSERCVRDLFALLRKIHVLIILVIFVDHSLEEVTFGGEAHALLGSIGFGKSASLDSATRKGCEVSSNRRWRCKLHYCGCFLSILDVSHAL
jgi:hypothetical protein